MCIYNGILLSNKKKLLMHDTICPDLQIMLSERSQAKTNIYNVALLLKIQEMETNV